jgi:hypothetical protein
MNNFNPVELKIILYTNIPNGNDYETSDLTFSTLVSEDLKYLVNKIKPTAYPYFSYQIKYPESSLVKLSYEDIVKTFFIKDKFIQKFKDVVDIIEQHDDKNNQISEDYYKKRTENINNNVMLMLRYLLPTKWPVINNHFNSYDLFNGKYPFNTLFFNPFSNSKYIYLRLSSGTYTVKKVIWLNDLLNNPEYKKNILNNNNFTVNNSSNNKLTNKLNKEDFEKIQDCYTSSCNNKELAYFGMKLNSTTYEIIVDIELFENEIKSGEENNVKCAYYSDYLGEDLSRLLKQRKKIKKHKGLINKMPLFSTKTMTSRKRGDINKEEIDEEKREKIKREEYEYNMIDRDIRDNYEQTIDKFFIKTNKLNIKSRIKKFDINKKNFYIFLEANLPELLEFISSNNSDKVINDVKKENKYTYVSGTETKSLKDKINEEIVNKLAEYTKITNTGVMSKTDYEKLKANFDLGKDLSNFVADKNIGGRLTKKKYNKIKRRYTTRRYLCK